MKHVVFALLSFITVRANAFDSWVEVNRALKLCGREQLFTSTNEIGKVIQDEITGGYEGFGCTTTVFSFKNHPNELFKIYACGEFDSPKADELRIWKNYVNTSWDKATKIFDFYQKGEILDCQ